MAGKEPLSYVIAAFLDRATLFLLTCFYQLCLASPGRKLVLFSRSAAFRRGRMQVQRPDALLQGSGHCLRAVGSSLYPVVQEESHGGGVGRARHDQEEAIAMVQERRRGCGIPLQDQQIRRFVHPALRR